MDHVGRKRVRDGSIGEPAPLDVDLVKRGQLTVAVPRRPVRPLTAEEVAETLASLRRRGDCAAVRTPATR